MPSEDPQSVLGDQARGIAPGGEPPSPAAPGGARTANPAARLLHDLRNRLRRYPRLTGAYRELRARRLAHRRPVPCPLGFRIAGTQAMEQGRYEPEETRFLQEQIRRVDLVVNVGANVGYYALPARQAGRRVIAFEPDPANYAVLVRNLAANGWEDVEAYPLALTDRSGLIRLYGWGTGASLVPGWAGSRLDRFRLAPAITLDRLLAGEVRGQRVLFIIDVEGAEYELLRGAQRQLVLDPAALWFIEISVSGHRPKDQGVNPHLLDTFLLFWNRGYRSYRLFDGLVETTAATVRGWARRPPAGFGGNFVFAKTDVRRLAG